MSGNQRQPSSLSDITYTHIFTEQTHLAIDSDIERYGHTHIQKQTATHSLLDDDGDSDSRWCVSGGLPRSFIIVALVCSNHCHGFRHTTAGGSPVSALTQNISSYV